MSNPYIEILVFACNWDGWSCIEAAANLGLSYPTSVKVVRVSCLSRIHIGLILKAFELGADGVMLLGCEPGKCRFAINSECIIKEYEKSRNVLDMLGASRDRLILVQLPAFSGCEFVTQIMSFITEVARLSASKHPRIMGHRPVQDIAVPSHTQPVTGKGR